jgi:hypothetical protein
MGIETIHVTAARENRIISLQYDTAVRFQAQHRSHFSLVTDSSQRTGLKQ